MPPLLFVFRADLKSEDTCKGNNGDDFPPLRPVVEDSAEGERVAKRAGSVWDPSDQVVEIFRSPSDISFRGTFDEVHGHVTKTSALCQSEP